MTFINKLRIINTRKSGFLHIAANKQKKVKWKSVVGLEVHAQISSKTKLFAGSASTFGSPLNSSVSLFDAAIPGTLPVLNRSCVEAGIKTALALNCQINPISMFDRKHYFYADLPAGYQITQQRHPLANNGVITFPVFVPGVTKKPYHKSVRLHQLQLEQDSGKSLHDDAAGKSLVDLNRAGIPLMELVFQPDLEDGEEAAALVKELILIFKRLGTCSCKMEEGALRVDANVSLHKEGDPLGTRTEIKNIGSVRSVAQAITYEIARQENILNSGEEINNETRSWDAVLKKTVSMRDKEVQQDYRFMPEPNLPPLHLDMGDSKLMNLIKVYAIKETIPELPEVTRKNLVDNFNLPEETAIILVNESILLNYFYAITEAIESVPAKTVSNFLINDLLTLCNKNDIDVEDCKISSNQLIDLVNFMQKETINLHIARLILQELQINSEKSVIEIINTKNLKQINEYAEIEKLCRECIERNQKAVAQYKSGKKKVFFALVGDIAKVSEQKANMAMVVKKLEELLKL